MNMADLEFPRLPDNKETLVYLADLKEVSKGMVYSSNLRIKRFGVILAGLSVLPIVDDYTYFLAHQECLKYYVDLGEAYNPIINKGEEYALKFLDPLLGDFEEFFNPFQLAFYPINIKMKSDDRFAPLGIILWTLYMGLYFPKKLDIVLEKVYGIIERSAMEQIASKLN